MYFYMYKTVNIVNGMVYVGVHKSEKEFDKEYYGSGLYLQRALKKYGKQSFRVEVLQYFDNEEEMYEVERIVVNESIVKSHQYYNLKLGGKGGWPIKGSLLALRNSKTMKKYWDNEEWREVTIKKTMEATKKIMNTPEMKQKIKEGLSNRSDDEKQNQYDNISKGIKRRFANMTELEREKSRKRKKIAMSRPEVRDNISNGMRGSEKLIGYNNPDFRKRWKPLYDSLIEEVVPMMVDDTIFDSDIVRYVKENRGQGIKIHKLLNYYESMSIIKIIETVKKKDYSTKCKILKNKTYIEVINENDC